ncbi:hypothetical protein EYF80_007562 [Liparis tanakae]|uniref:Uncharacterized protein n=1 Tax=Liparis tanakae TaxID=230148 RepID=A0A4Z2IXD1_9TELE|nr:hypothetical protein EYF80_007562 [Liparis tanakae]
MFSIAEIVGQEVQADPEHTRETKEIALKPKRQNELHVCVSVTPPHSVHRLSSCHRGGLGNGDTEGGAYSGTGKSRLSWTAGVTVGTLGTTGTRGSTLTRGSL